MFPVPDGLVPAYNTTTGVKSHVPPHWLVKDGSPFPGQWAKTPQSAAAEKPASGKKEN